MINTTRFQARSRQPLYTLVPVLVSSCMLSACATMMSGSYQSVRVDSVPQGAKVFTGVLSMNRPGNVKKRKEVGVTPMTVSITRKDGVVELEKPGYLLTRVPMRRGTNPWFLGNVLMTSLLSSMIDSSTGAISEYDPDQYRVELPRDDDYVPGPEATVEERAAYVPPPAAEDGEEPYVPDVRPLSPPPAAQKPAEPSGK